MSGSSCSVYSLPFSGIKPEDKFHIDLHRTPGFALSAQDRLQRGTRKDAGSPGLLAEDGVAPTNLAAAGPPANAPSRGLFHQPKRSSCAVHSCSN